MISVGLGVVFSFLNKLLTCKERKRCSARRTKILLQQSRKLNMLSTCSFATCVKQTGKNYKNFNKTEFIQTMLQTPSSVGLWPPLPEALHRRTPVRDLQNFVNSFGTSRLHSRTESRTRVAPTRKHNFSGVQVTEA